MATILEALLNADANLANGAIGIFIAKEQLHNATVLLVKGYKLNDVIEPLLEEHGEVEDVPGKSTSECKKFY